MRWFNIRRMLMVLLLLPLFLIIFLVNNFFLLLDYIIFPSFTRQEVKNPVVIVSAPRSATTYLFHTLAKHEKYTSMKLWEIVFAPSICQKYLISGIIKADAQVGAPIKKTILKLEHLMVGKLKRIHLIGLNLPEEDEGVLIWNLSTFYFNFFYPDSHFFDDLVLFDQEMSEKGKLKIMRTYANMVRRHNYVFNRHNTKQYLSKNPLMMPKVGGLALVFPNARILNINRCPSKTLPSTLQLNTVLYALFSSRKPTTEVNERSLEILIRWYQLCEENLQKHFKNAHLKIDFGKLVSYDPNEQEKIASFLQLDSSIFDAKPEMKSTHKSANAYTEFSEDKMEKIMRQLPFMSPYCQS